MSESEVRVAIVSAPDEAVAARLARVLVEERLAACVNLLPGVRSVYRWEGRIEEDAEWLLFAKTTARRLAALRARIDELHPYDLPEVVALPVVGGSAGYLAWVVDETTPPKTETTP